MTFVQPVSTDGIREAAVSDGPTNLAPMTTAPTPETPPQPAPTPETPAEPPAPAPVPEPAEPAPIEDVSERVDQAIRQLNDLLQQGRQDRERELAAATRQRQEENDPLFQIINDPEATPRERMLAEHMIRQRGETAALVSQTQAQLAAQADADIASEVRDFSRQFVATPAEINAWRRHWDSQVEAGVPGVENLTYTEFVGRTIGMDKLLARFKSTSQPPQPAAPASATRVPGAPIAVPAQGGGTRAVTPAVAGEDFDRTTDRLLVEQFGIRR